MLPSRRFNPFEEINREFNHMLNRHFGLSGSEGAEERGLTMWTPRADVCEQPEEIVVRIDLPGIEEKDVAVSVENNVLTVSGERRTDRDEPGAHYHRVECVYGSFSRSFNLPQTVDVDRIKAHFRNGVLQLSLPKREESKPRRIDVKLS